MMNDTDAKSLFVTRLKELIKENNLNISKLAMATGIPRTSMTNWINGKRTIQIDSLVKIAKFFNVSTDYLLGLKEI